MSSQAAAAAGCRAVGWTGGFCVGETPGGGGKLELDGNRGCYRELLKGADGWHFSVID